MNDPVYVAAGIAIAVGITFLLRAVPFLIKDRIGESELLGDLGRWMPLGAIAILMMYCLAEIEVGERPYGAPEALGIIATVAVHLRWRNAVASIIAGAGTALIAANLVF